MKHVDVKAHERFLSREEKTFKYADDNGWGYPMRRFPTVQCDWCGKVGEAAVRDLENIYIECPMHYGMSGHREVLVWRKVHDINLWRARRGV